MSVQKSALRPRRRTLADYTTLPRWCFSRNQPDEIVMWYLRINGKLPDSFPWFGGCDEITDDSMNLNWHTAWLLRRFLNLTVQDGNEYDAVSEEDIRSSDRWTPSFRRPTYRKLVSWFYKKRVRFAL